MTWGAFMSPGDPEDIGELTAHTVHTAHTHYVVHEYINALNYFMFKI